LGTGTLNAEDISAQLTLLPLSEMGLAALDKASETMPIDQGLLQTTPARDLTECLSSLVSSFRTLDVEKVQSKTSWWDRLIGTDVEAQLEFNLACQNLNNVCQVTRERAEAARNTGSLLWRTRQQLEQDQNQLQGLIELVRRTLAASPSDVNSDIRARFERRLANLMALSAANSLTLKQIDLSIGVLRGLLDRHVEIDQLVKPLWERVGLAAAQGVTGDVVTQKTPDLSQLHAGLVNRIDTLLQGSPHV
jgi:hypothetical protein